MWLDASAARDREGGRSGVSERLVGRDCPDEAGELAGAGNDDLLLRFAAASRRLPTLVEAILAAPGAFDVGRLLAAVGGRVGSRLSAAGGRARSTRRSRRAWLLPTLVIVPCRRCSPEECSDVTRPTNAMSRQSSLRRPGAARWPRRRAPHRERGGASRACSSGRSARAASPRARASQSSPLSAALSAPRWTPPHEDGAPRPVHARSHRRSPAGLAAVGRCQ